VCKNNGSLKSKAQAHMICEQMKAFNQFHNRDSKTREIVWISGTQ